MRRLSKPTMTSVWLVLALLCVSLAPSLAPSAREDEYRAEQLAA